MKQEPSQPSRRHHEDKDIDVSAVTRLAGALVVILSLCCLVSAGYFFVLAGWVRHHDGPILSPLPKTEKSFPPPQIQANPKSDYLEYYRASEERLNQYRWIDREKGIVAIPIDLAMELLLERGLPHGREVTSETAPTWQEMLQSRASQGEGGSP